MNEQEQLFLGPTDEQLRAAAPEMYRALKRTAPWTRYWKTMPATDKTVLNASIVENEINAALAKAEGRSVS